MRARWLFFLILLHCLAAAGGEVVVEPQMTTLAPTMQHLRDSCAISGVYDACTRFVAYRLEAVCAPEGSSWKLHVAAKFRPWVFLRNMHQLAHEQEHVRDIRELVERHLAAIEAAVFANEAACQQNAFTAMGGFGDTLREFARRSNAFRHPLSRSCCGHRAEE
jgi:hypothetical protein